MRSYGLPFQEQEQFRDVGLTMTAGRVRPSQVVKQRFEKAEVRRMRVANLANISCNARKLLNGSAFSASTYGHSGSALSNSEIIQLERDALTTTGLKPRGRCRALGLIVTCCILGRLRARIIGETVRAWFKLLRDSTELELSEI